MTALRRSVRVANAKSRWHTMKELHVACADPSLCCIELEMTFFVCTLCGNRTDFLEMHDVADKDLTCVGVWNWHKTQCRAINSRQ